MKKSMKPKIHSKILLYFLLFTTFILLLIWLMQILFLNTYYEKRKMKEVESIAKDVIQEYNSNDFEGYLRNAAFQNELTIYVFTNTNQKINIKFSSERNIPGGNNIALTDFIERLDGKDSLSYITDINISFSPEGKPNDKQNLKTIVYGQIRNIDNEQIYFFVCASLLPIANTTSILASQLLIITVICFLFSVGLSFYMSRKLSKPILDLQKSAEQLSNGNLNISFDAKGFQEVEYLSDTLNYATMELKKTDELRKDLIANVSHELRTPLTIIKGYTEMIQDFSGDNKAKRTEHLEAIMQETERLAVLVKDILDLSRLQSGFVKYEKTIFNFSNSLKNVFTFFKGIYEKEEFTFISEITEELYIEADEKRLEQVVYNVLANAINYSRDQKVIEVRLHKKDMLICLEIQDHGIGISEEEKPYVFEKFFQSTNEGKTKIGTGIGLSIVKSILDAHNYEYGIKSILNEGSTFYLNIKVNEEDQ